jgi:hypothetical protein
MIDTRREFNLVFCPNDPNPKAKELVKVMTSSGQKLVRLLVIGRYCYNSRLEMSRLDRTLGAQIGAVKMVAWPDLMRHYVFMDFRVSDVVLGNLIKFHERIPANIIRIVTRYCDTCSKHFTHTELA